jgi:hypothetical protein
VQQAAVEHLPGTRVLRGLAGDQQPARAAAAVPERVERVQQPLNALVRLDCPDERVDDLVGEQAEVVAGLIARDVVRV